MLIIRKKYLLGFLIFASNGYAMQCSLDGADVRFKQYDVGTINVETVDGYFKKSISNNIGALGYINCRKAAAGEHGRNIRVESRLSSANICLEGTTRITGPGGAVRPATWSSTVTATHPVFQTRRDRGRFSHTGTNYTLKACNASNKIAPGVYSMDVMAFSWQRVGGTKGTILYKVKVNVTEAKASCKIANPGSSTISFGKLMAGTGIYQKYYDALISCNKPTSFKYRLHSATPQISSLPLETNNDKYLGIGLNSVNGALWVSSVNNSNPLSLSGRLNSADTSYIRINSRVNTDAKNINSSGGVLSGSAILEINVD